MLFRSLAKNFIKSLLNPDPVARPTATQALQDSVSIQYVSLHLNGLTLSHLIVADYTRAIY
jgi:hypothetical protein